MRRLVCHRNSVVLILLLAGAASALARQNNSADAQLEYAVLSDGRPVGHESVTITRSAEGWTLSASETIGPPLDLNTTRFLLRYSPDWHPVALNIEGTLGGRTLQLSTTFADGVATTRGTQQGAAVDVTHTLSPTSILLPAGFFASYAGLAARLGSTTQGSTLPLYILPQGEVTGTVTRITSRRFTGPASSVDLRQYDMTLATAGAPVRAEIWVDTQGHLARLAVSGSGLIVMRTDLLSGMVREETITRAGDQEVFIPANGFTMAATLSRPAGAATRAPAVLMIGAAGTQDRDEVTARVPVFGHLANALADAGVLVLRYDKRGVGRSGGRTESATLSDYADDAIGLVKWLKKRPDVDPKRIAVLGYGEGGAMALLAATRAKDIAAVALVAAPGQTGREVTLLQQQASLVAAGLSESDRQIRVAQQELVISATIKGTGWETIPQVVRQRADTPWFKSWLLFDPAAVMPKVKQPLLIVTGTLDTLFPPAQADRLETLGLARKKLPPAATQKILVPGVNHLLVNARSGGEAEYAELSGAVVAVPITTAVTDWLKTTLPPKK